MTIPKHMRAWQFFVDLNMCKVGLEMYIAKLNNS